MTALQNCYLWPLTVLLEEHNRLIKPHKINRYLLMKYPLEKAYNHRVTDHFIRTTKS